MVAVVGAAPRWVVVLVAAVVAAGCAPWQPADDAAARDGGPSAGRERVVQAPPEWYSVSRGDTLYSIAFRYGLDWRKVAEWNDISAPYTIRPGDELRMTAPPQRSRRPSAGRESTEDAPSEPRNTPASASSGNDAAPETPPQPEEPAAQEATDEGAYRPSASRSAGGVAWQWPTEGDVTRAFDPAATRKGIGIAGSSGQTVHAAAAGTVVYSGTALIGYGELIIVKHSDELLSAYGHNRRRLVAEGDRVGRGQPIAEMGVNDRQEEMLHFEVRRDGEPVNPLDYLPKK